MRNLVEAACTARAAGQACKRTGDWESDIRERPLHPKGKYAEERGLKGGENTCAFGTGARE